MLHDCTLRRRLMGSTGIRYVPKYVDPGVPSNTSPAPAGSAPTAVNARGYIYPVYEDGTYETNTCLISAGMYHSLDPLSNLLTS